MSRIYKTIIVAADRFVPTKLRPLWNHEAGPKTIFFWAPAFKWGLVLAGLGDINRPVETLSVPQCVSLAATGLIWSRYSLVIIPKNHSLFAALVIAGLGDINRPAQSLSISQCGSLAITGLVWSRYSLVMVPKNWNLFAALVGASIDEYRRPLDKVSTTQSASLAATGLIWTRYCLVIKPINYSLSLCNFMLGLANAIQCFRAYKFQKNI